MRRSTQSEVRTARVGERNRQIMKQQVRWTVAAYVQISDMHGRILMVRRARGRSHFPGSWELPGGKPAQGGSIDETALREVREESGLRVRLREYGTKRGECRCTNVCALVNDNYSSPPP